MSSVFMALCGHCEMSMPFRYQDRKTKVTKSLAVYAEGVYICAGCGEEYCQDIQQEQIITEAYNEVNFFTHENYLDDGGPDIQEDIRITLDRSQGVLHEGARTGGNETED